MLEGMKCDVFELRSDIEDLGNNSGVGAETLGVTDFVVCGIVWQVGLVIGFGA